jgi:phosphatidylinositol alpha-1,6-mannosyltransferase
VILTVGRLAERKGHDIVLRALPTVLRKFPETRYLIVGTGPEEQRLRHLAVELGVAEQVVFAGRMPDEDLPDCYAACDVFVMVSREIPAKGDVEGFGIVYLEANAQGKPVVGARSGGVADAVEDGVTGLMVDSTDPENVADAILRLLANKDWAACLGIQGRNRVRTEFSMEVLARRMQSVLANSFGV